MARHEKKRQVFTVFYGRQVRQVRLLNAIKFEEIRAAPGEVLVDADKNDLTARRDEPQAPELASNRRTRFVDVLAERGHNRRDAPVQHQATGDDVGICRRENPRLWA